MNTPIVYYGGKTTMLPHILKLIPVHTCYTEVFFGGGAVFWAKKSVANETINDKLDIVVNFYRQLKCNYIKLKQAFPQEALEFEKYKQFGVDPGNNEIAIGPDF